MADSPPDQLSGELAERLHQAEELSRKPELAAAFAHVAADPKLWADVSRDPVAFLAEQGVEVPKGLGIEVLDDPLRGRPTPDFEFFSIRLTRCRTYWVKKENGPGWEKVEVCFGIEIVPNPVPGGPIG